MNHHCKVLCRIGSLNKAQVKAFKSRISDDYRVNMWVPGLGRDAACAGGESRPGRVSQPRLKPHLVLLQAALCVRPVSRSSPARSPWQHLLLRLGGAACAQDSGQPTHRHGSHAGRRRRAGQDV